MRHVPIWELFLQKRISSNVVYSCHEKYENSELQEREIWYICFCV